jgi:hypothetical protein
MPSGAISPVPSSMHGSSTLTLSIVGLISLSLSLSLSLSKRTSFLLDSRFIYLLLFLILL